MKLELLLLLIILLNQIYVDSYSLTSKPISIQLSNKQTIEIEGLTQGRDCGSAYTRGSKRNGTSTRIGGGMMTAEGQFPSYVRLFIPEIPESLSEFMCGGTLISKDIVTTAAHCIWNRSGSIRAQIGYVSDRTHSLNEPKFQIRSAKDVCVSEKYSDQIPNPTDDVAILKLSKPVEFNEFVQPACLMKDQAIKSSDTIYAVGMGEIAPNRPSQDLLHLPMTTCNQFFGLNNHPTHTCLNTDRNRKSGIPCMGDSGGPVIVIRQTPHGPRQFVTGAMSFITEVGGCSAGRDNLFYSDFYKMRREIEVLLDCVLG